MSNELFNKLVDVVITSNGTVDDKLEALRRFGLFTVGFMSGEMDTADLNELRRIFTSYNFEK